MSIRFILDGREVASDRPPLDTALAVLREDCGVLSLRGACGIGLCGTCTMIVDGRLTSACLMPLGALEGREVRTVHGLADGRVRAAFEEANAAQCGYCIPAMVVAATVLIEEKPDPTDDEIDAALAGNICRCGCYLKIRGAVRRAARTAPS